MVRRILLLITVFLFAPKIASAVTCGEIVAATSATTKTLAAQTNWETLHADRDRAVSLLAKEIRNAPIELVLEKPTTNSPVPSPKKEISRRRTVLLAELTPETVPELDEYRLELLNAMHQLAVPIEGPELPTFAAAYADPNLIHRFLTQLDSDVKEAVSPSAGKVAAIGVGTALFWPVGMYFGAVALHRTYIKDHLAVEQFTADVRKVLTNPLLLPPGKFLSLDIRDREGALTFYFQMAKSKFMRSETEHPALFVTFRR